MKMEIDLAEIFARGTEDGSSWQDVVHDAVVEHIAEQIMPETKKRMNEQISKAIDEAVASVIKEQLPNLLTNLIDMEYTPVDQYGRKSEPTNLRKALLDTLVAQMAYKKGSYSSDSNAFTKAVDALVEYELSKFKKEFNSQVTAQFVNNSTQFAITELRKKFGLPTA